MWKKSLWFAAILVAVACDTPEPAVDAGPLTDGGPLADAGPLDAGPIQVDAGPLCPAGQGSLRGVCVRDCGADLAALDASLNAGLTVLGQVCELGASRAFEGADMYRLTAMTTGNETSFTLAEGALTEPFDVAPTFTTLAESTFDTGDAAMMTFAGGFLALAPGLGRAAYGYTINPDFNGAVFVADLSASPAPAPVSQNAPGNFDVTFLDADVALVNGQGLLDAADGQGLYAIDLSTDPPVAWKVVSNVGDFSGSVVAGADFVLVGGLDESFVSHTFVIAASAVAAAQAGGALDGGLDGTGGSAAVVELTGAPSSTFELLAADRVAFTPFAGPLTASTFTWDGAAATLSDEVTLATGDTFSGVHTLPNGRLLMVHGSGGVIVEE